MTTFSELNLEIQDELIRDDLTPQVSLAIKSAIKHYEKDRLHFNEVRAKTVTAPNTEWYAVPSDLVEIDSLDIKVNGATYDLDPRPYQYLQSIYTTEAFTGPPVMYAVYDEQLRLYPVPDDSYTLVMSYAYKLDELSATSDTNAWLDDGKQLIKSRAKWDILLNVIKDPQQAAGQKAAEIEAKVALEELGNGILTGGGIIPRI